jgi:hypothetical protein
VKIIKAIFPGAVVLVLALAACGSTAGSSPASSTTSAAPAAAPAGSCSIYDSGHDAQILVTSGGQAECDTLAQSLSTGGDFWTSQQQNTTDALSMVCVMDNAGNVAEVIDGGGQIIGQSICASMRANGWTEDTAAEQQANQAAASAAAQASQAQASASAADAQASANASAEQTAQSDLSTVQGVSFASDLSSISGDVTTTNNDLATTRSDAAQGPGDQCVNASSTVYNDAASTVYNDQQSALYNDAGTLSTDIGNARTAITSLSNDLSGLSSAGLPAPAGASAAITAARQAIGEAIGQANGGIAQINADVVTAYQVANSIATGACAGQGPGNPPSPIAPLS